MRQSVKLIGYTPRAAGARVMLMPWYSVSGSADDAGATSDSCLPVAGPVSGMLCHTLSMVKNCTSQVYVRAPPATATEDLVTTTSSWPLNMSCRMASRPVADT